MNILKSIKKELKSKSNPEKVEVSKWFFKTGKGEYGEGDIFLGLNSQEIKDITKKYYEIDLKMIEKLLHSEIHEERACALHILIKQFEKGDRKKKGEIYKFYLKNIKRVNNWDLVDVSADKIIGAHLFNFTKGSSRIILRGLAKSKNLWERRIAVISTLHFIKNNQFDDILKISEILLNDKHDLIHKAVGWMLREVGKRDLAVEEKFLKKHYKKMPRTMLRYAIEKFPESKRIKYLKNEILKVIF